MQADDNVEIPMGLLVESGDGLCVLTVTGRIVFWNDAACNLLHIPQSEAIGAHLAELSRTPESRDTNWGHHIVSLGSHMSGNPPVRRVLNTRDNRGQPVIVHVSSAMIRSAGQLPLIAYSFTVESVHRDSDLEVLPPMGLTAREWEVACLLMSGLGTSESARELGIAYATVRAHIRNILVALGAHTRTQALMRLWSRYGTPEMPYHPTRPRSPQGFRT